MIKKFLCGSVFAILLATVTIFAQSGAAIHGKWRLDGQTTKTNGGNSVSWFLEWTFADENFSLAGCPPLNQKGKYQIVKEVGGKLILKLYNQTGDFGTKDKQIEIVLDTENDTLKIDGKENFKRIEK